MKARDGVRDELIKQVAQAEKISQGEVSEDELLSMPFPGLKESPIF